MEAEAGWTWGQQPRLLQCGPGAPARLLCPHHRPLAGSVHTSRSSRKSCQVRLRTRSESLAPPPHTWLPLPALIFLALELLAKKKSSSKAL